MDSMNKWFEEGIEDDKIILALNEAIKAKKKNIRYIDKILLEWRQQQERKEEGYTTITDNWHKDIKETNEIANLSWVRKNENK
jgi:DnaD/phage-associated family protein